MTEATNEGRGATTTAVAPTTRSARLLLVDLDPYVTHVVRQRLPGLHITEVPTDAELLWALGQTGGPTVVLVDTASPRLGTVLLARRRVRVIGCASRDDEPWVTADLDAVLVRPFTADEVEDLVGRVVASEVARPPDHAPPGPRWATWMGRRTSLAYLGATLLAAPLELATGQTGRWVLLLLVLAYVTGRTWWRPPRAVAVDVALATMVLALTGGPDSSYVLLGLAVTVHAGLGGSLMTATRAAAVVACSVVGVLPAVAAGPRPTTLLSYVAVFPAVAATTAQSVRLARLRQGRDDPDLASSRRVRDGLGEAHRRARVGGAHVTVEDAAQSIADDATDLGAAAALVLLASPGGHLEVASAGVLPHTPIVVATSLAEQRPGRLRPLHQPPERVSSLDGDLDWYELELRDTGTTAGLLLFGLPHGDVPPDTMACDQLARRGAVALATTQSLVRLRELATDRERLILAGQLQDEVGQGLVHLRLELELLADRCEDDLAHELHRLVTVVQRHLAQVQATVADLRSSSLPVGLAAALRQYARDLSAVGGPTIEVRSRTRLRLAPDREQAVFEIVCAAVADAHRHVGATQVVVVVDELDAHVRVSVEDDGLPLHEPARAQRELVGRLRGRATSVGAALHAMSTPERGSRLEIVCRDPDSYLVLP